MRAVNCVQNINARCLISYKLVACSQSLVSQCQSSGKGGKRNKWQDLRKAAVELAGI